MFLITPEDSVVTLLTEGRAGEERAVVGASERLRLAEDVPAWHKAARRAIRTGEAVIKYGVSIGRATRDIAPGEWVHLHNMASFVDEKSGTLDLRSGVDTARRYD